MPLRLVLLCLLAFCRLAAAEHPRVAKARRSHGAQVARLFEKVQVRYPAAELYLRAFKAEREIEVWASDRGRPMALVKTFPVCAASGELGPKREEGDLQVPEGFYRVSSFNPGSAYHLSFQIDYPNASDRLLGTKGRLGGQIYVHGSCASVGCLSIEDDPIEELYLMVADAAAQGATVPVHVFPTRMDDQGRQRLASAPRAKVLADFWKQLEPGFAVFEATHRPPRIAVDRKSGRYEVAPATPTR